MILLSFQHRSLTFKIIIKNGAKNQANVNISNHFLSMKTEATVPLATSSSNFTPG